jgi:hypothetical protein
MFRCRGGPGCVASGSVGDALGTAGKDRAKAVIDVINLVGATSPDGFASNTEYIKARAAGQAGRGQRVGRSSRT